MAYKLRTEIGQAIYRLRKCTVEPVIGIIKAGMGFRQFSLRYRPGRLRMVLGLFGLQSEAPTHVVLGLTTPKACQTGVQPRRNAAEHRKSTQLDGQTRRNMPC